MLQIFTSSQSLPEVIRVEKPRQSLVKIHHVCLAFIPHNDPGILPITILLHIHIKFLIYLQHQAVRVIDHTPSRSISTIHTLQLQFLQARLQVCELGGKALRLNLQIVGGLGDAKFLRV